MAVCRGCGAQINPQERFCGYCGTDQYAAPPQPPYGMAPGPTVDGAGGAMARVAMALGVAGGLLGVLWGALGPYLTYKWPEHFRWSEFGTGIRFEILLVVGLVLGVLGIAGGLLAPRARGAAAVLLFVCGLVGFIVGGSWLIPGALLLVAAGLALASRWA